MSGNGQGSGQGNGKRVMLPRITVETIEQLDKYQQEVAQASADEFSREQPTLVAHVASMKSAADSRLILASMTFLYTALKLQMGRGE